MKPMKNKKFLSYILVGIAVVALISWDMFSVKRVKVNYPLYSFLSEIDKTKKDSTKVAIIGSDYSGLVSSASLNSTLTQSQIEDMVNKALDLQGAASKILKPGIKVLIKPNIVGAVADRIGENTDTRVVKAVVKYVHEKCGGNCTIKIGEGSPRPMPYETKYSGGSASWTKLWDKTGYPEVIDELKGLGINVDTVNLNGGSTIDPLQNLREMSVPNGGYAKPQKGKYYIHKDIVEADVYITVPVLKVHNPGVTVGLKNQIGIAAGNRYGFNKVKGVNADGNVNKLRHNSDVPRDWTDEEIVDLSLLAGIDLVVVDATLCLEKQKSYSSSMANQVRMNAIVVGNDPVAVDNVCARMAGFNPDDVDHINLAELAGMGTNNPDLINIVGTPMSHVSKRLKKSTGDLRLLFGQTNRKWLVSQSFSVGGISNPMTNQFIKNEADYEAKPGVEGWSQPVYFFDDNIDLGNYFNYPDDIMAYAFTNVYSPEETDAVLQVGSDEGLYIYLNHSPVYSYSGMRTYNYIAETRTVHLNKGYNTLLVKSLQMSGNHDFAMNLCEVESASEFSGNRIEGLKFYPVLTGPNKIDRTFASNFKLTTYPNPATDHATISLEIKEPGNYKIEVFDLQGKRVRTLINEYLTSGRQTFDWDLCSDKGFRLNAGTYFIKEFKTGKSIKLMVK